MFTVWHRLFSLVIMFPGLRIEALPISTVQGKCIYTFLKRRTRKFNFVLCTKPSKDKHKFLFFQKVGSPWVNLSAIIAKVKSSGPIY